MKTKLVLLIMTLLLSSVLFTACNQKLANGDESIQGDQDKQIKDSLEKDLNIEIFVSEQVLQDYKAKIISYVHALDKKSLREEAAFIQNEYKDDQQMQDTYALLYYRSVFEGNYGSEEYPLPKENLEPHLLLEKESIQDQPITEALIDIGIITSVSEEDLQAVRDELIRLIRGKAETEKEFYAYLDKLTEKRASMTPVNSSAYLQVYKAAKEEASYGSKTYPLPEGN